MRRLLVFFLALSASGITWAQTTFPAQGMSETSNLYAITGAKVVSRFDASPRRLDLLVKDGKIVTIGAPIRIPDHAIVIDASGLFIYPSFIDLYTSYGLDETSRSPWDPFPQYETETPGAYAWNEALKPEYRAAADFEVNSKSAASMRSMGFGVVLAHREDGISRGSGVLAALTTDNPQTAILKPDASSHLSFYKGTSRQSYPSSLMGMMALLRQTYLDADWYKRGGKEVERNLSLEAWNNQSNLPTFFLAGDYLSTLRASRIAKEFNKRYIFFASGDEYKRLDLIKATNAKFVLPLNFPDAYDVEDPRMAEFVALGDMKHWELAPANPAFFEKEGISFALTAKDSDDFWGNLRKAMEYGLSEQAALKALTYNPASFLGLAGAYGSLNRNMAANFLITSAPIFDEEMEIMENWAMGKRHVLKSDVPVDLRGDYDVAFAGNAYKLEVTGDKNSPRAKLWVDSTDISVDLNQTYMALSFTAHHDSIFNGTVRFSGYSTGETWAGNGTTADGTWHEFTAIRTKAFTPEAEEEEETEVEVLRDLGEVWFPNKAYGRSELPAQGAVLFRNATVWTGTEEGILEKTDVAIQNGKIIAIGRNLSKGLFRGSKAQEIDATGKHLTAGIIDEHSHIAISRGVNESGQNSSAEVRIGDVINPDDINIYRQLSGGVTAAQLLHGSANPIGGQSAIIKLRWGAGPEDFKIKGADGFIKFALGENVKQTNWGDYQTVRYPQTRMGVEQAFYDYFWRAKAYERKKNGAVDDGIPFRKDLEMETLLEILNSERFVSCHSYIQSEINMLMHVADSMGFTLNTFTHILEGYKLADKMAKHGAGGSTFSDWWAYKYEVNEAIPYNAALMASQGVVVAINSDDAEMARRLNQEAAKGVKYGGMSEEEAWKMVTLNPAKLLHLDDRMGSIEKGKDADVVLWNNRPLSIDAMVLQTYVDGRLMFDREEDEALRENIKAERARLIQAMLDAKAGGERVRKPKPVHKHLYHCDDLEE